MRISGAEGVELHLLEWSREGVPLLLLHGFGNEAHIWDDFAPAVAPYYRTLALDHRGHGESGWAASVGGYELELFVRDLELLVESLGLERMVLVAHSLGGRVAMLFAGRHPDRMAGLVLVDIGPELDARGTTRIRQDVASSPTPTFRRVEDYASALTIPYPAATPQALQRMAHHGLRRREDGLYELRMDPKLRLGIGRPQESPEQARARERALSTALWEALGKISCPALVVRGAASDILSPEVAERMAEEVLAKGRLATVPRAGHSVMTDNPDGFREAVSAFVLAGG